MIAVDYIKHGDGWLAKKLPQGAFDPPALAQEPLIEERAALTNGTGKHPLWQGYQDVPNYPRAENKQRRADQVRTTTKYGRFYGWLVEAFDARSVVEFGTAFGVSGMYWLAGLKKTGGTLFTFEPNDLWAKFAKENLETIEGQFRLTLGTFEDNVEAVVPPASVDVAFIDAIHTSDFVFSQFEILKSYMRPGGIILLDDINFSDDMRECWRTVSNRPDVSTSATIASRVGIVELPG